MPSKELLKEFARLAIQKGVQPKKGQMLVISAPVMAYEFVETVVTEAYKFGVGQVSVNWMDNAISRLNYENVETEVLKEVPSWFLDKYEWAINKGACMLNIMSPNPDLLKGIDQNKIREVEMEQRKARVKYQYYTMNNVGQWSIIAYPNKEWANKVFPELSDEEAIEKLWNAILDASRVFEGRDAIKEWDEHDKNIREHSKKLNDYNFKSLHFKNKYGTDLNVALVEDHIWCGGDEETTSGARFNPNIPTEEVFTMPDCRKTDGKVVSTKPLSYAGKLISRFELTFKDGVVVDYKADDNEEVLKQLLDTDEGSKSIGEVALISYDSPISKSGILFYNTLFDENASCHLALGASYPMTLKGGTEMSDEERYEKGGNKSMNHVDFMFGSEDMSVVGETYDGELIEVFKDGNFCI